MRINDQIFQIGEINVRNMSSEQVASVLRQSSMQGQMVKFIVARPIHNPVGDVELLSTSIEKIEFDANNKPIITNLKSPNSQSVVVKTSEILTDKKLNLLQLIEAERAESATNTAKQMQSELAEAEVAPAPSEPPPPITTTTTTTTTTTCLPVSSEQQKAVSNEQSVKPAAVEESSLVQASSSSKKALSAALERIDEIHLVLRISSDDATVVAVTDAVDQQPSCSLLDRFNSVLKKQSITLGLYTFETSNYFMVKEITSDEATSTTSTGEKLEPYDCLVEVNGQPIERIIQEPKSFAETTISNLKFRNDPAFKIKVTFFSIFCT